ncbi:MAG: DUF885 family protein, partial [Gammaproteobacteria bacterium]
MAHHSVRSLLALYVLTLLWTLPAAAHSESLNAFFERAWEIDLKNNPLLASNLGDLRYNALWPDRSIGAIAAQHASDRKFLAQVRQLDQTDMDEHDLLNIRLFEQKYRQRVNNYRFRQFLQPVNQRGGIQTAGQLTERLQFTTLRQYEDWLARLKAFDTYMDQTIALMGMGITERRTHPAIIMQRVPEQIKAQLVAPEDSGFYAPFKSMPDAIDAGKQQQLQRAALDAVKNVVIPAYRKLLAFVDDEYLPASRDSVGAWDLPDGATFYARRVKDFTTTELTPDEVHDIGLSEVKRLREQMQLIIEQVEFDGSFAEFLEFLRTDKQFYYDNPDDLLQAYLATSKRIDPELIKLFKVLPRMPY